MIEASAISLIYNNEIEIGNSKSMERKGVKSLTPIMMWSMKIIHLSNEN